LGRSFIRDSRNRVVNQRFRRRRYFGGLHDDGSVEHDDDGCDYYDHGAEEHDHGSDHYDHGCDHYDHGCDYYDHGCDYYDHGCDYYDHGCDYYDHGCDHYDHGCDHYDHGCDHYDHGCDHYDHGAEEHDHRTDHHDHHDHRALSASDEHPLIASDIADHDDAESSASAYSIGCSHDGSGRFGNVRRQWRRVDGQWNGARRWTRWFGTRRTSSASGLT
jgi:hypothetical protein